MHRSPRTQLNRRIAALAVAAVGGGLLTLSLACPAIADQTGPGTIGLSPVTGGPGTTIHVTSQTPCPPAQSGQVLVRAALLDGQSAVQAQSQTSADPSGSWSVDLVVPASATAGTDSVAAGCWSSGNSNPYFVYQPQPFEVCSPSTAMPSTTTTVPTSPSTVPESASQSSSPGLSTAPSTGGRTSSGRGTSVPPAGSASAPVVPSATSQTSAAPAAAAVATPMPVMQRPVDARPPTSNVNQAEVNGALSMLDRPISIDRPVVASDRGPGRVQRPVSEGGLSGPMIAVIALGGFALLAILLWRIGVMAYLLDLLDDFDDFVAWLRMRWLLVLLVLGLAGGLSFGGAVSCGAMNNAAAAMFQTHTVVLGNGAKAIVDVKDDGHGHKETVTTTTDSEGRKTGQTIVTETNDGDGKTTTTTRTYDGDGHDTGSTIVEKTDHGNGTTTQITITYDGNGHETSRTTVTTTDDGNGHVKVDTTKTDAEGHVSEQSSSTYSSNGTGKAEASTTINNADGSTTSIHVVDNGDGTIEKTTQTTDPNGHVTKTVVEKQNKQRTPHTELTVTDTNRDGSKTEIHAIDNGDGTRTVTTTTYDASGNMTGQTTTTGAVKP